MLTRTPHLHATYISTLAMASNVFDFNVSMFPAVT